VFSVSELFRPHGRNLRIPGGWIYAPIVVFLAGLGIWAVVAENDFSFYWRDPAAIVNTGPWIGLFSNIGVFIWWIAAVIAIFTGVLLRWAPGRGTISAFLLSWGALTGILALDDFFMIHEWVIPTYLPLSDDFMFGVYFVVALFLIVLFRDEILRSPYPLFLFALACFSASILIDVVGPFRPVDWGLPARLVWNLEYVVEDGFKLIGIIAWAHYFALVSFGVIKPYLTGTGNTNTVPLKANTVPLATQRLKAQRRERAKVR
jgi:hypothetical protein